MKTSTTLTAVFIFSLLTANLLSAAKLINIGGFTVDAGLLVFPISYIVGDIIVDVYGYKASRHIIWLGFILSGLFALSLYIVSILPPDPQWTGYAGDSAYQSILSGVYSLVPASLLGYLVGEFINAKTLVFFKARGVHRIGYFIYSTLFGEAADTVLFFGAATLLGVFPVELLPNLILINYVVKVLVEIAVVPLTSKISQRIQHANG